MIGFRDHASLRPGFRVGLWGLGSSFALFAVYGFGLSSASNSAIQGSAAALLTDLSLRGAGGGSPNRLSPKP